MGEPRGVVERVAQWVWRWRVEIAVGYIVVAVTAAVIIEIRK
jgi:hypothetical protein